MFWYLVFAVVAGRVLLWLLEKVDLTTWRFRARRRLKTVAGLFVNNYIDGKSLFVARYGQVASIGVVTQVDATAVYALAREKLKDVITDIHQVNMYDHDEQRTFFNHTILELQDKRMIEIGNGYVEVLYTSRHYDWAMQLLLEFAACKVEVQVVEEEKAPTVIGFARAMEMN